MNVVNKTFNAIREILKSAVPLCDITIDNNYRYEVRAKRTTIP